MDAQPGFPRVGTLPCGPLDSLCDVAGVTVGHATLARGALQTGVTVVRPHAGDLYRDKVPAAASVLNGFGKSVGLVQVEELGVLETPIALTNTFAVGTVANAQIRQAVAANAQIGRDWPTVNPLVFECNDGYLNDIQAMAVTEADYVAAFDDAGPHCAQGAVGAGRGMSCFGFKGGIGSASRRTRQVEGRSWMVGALVLANFGRQPLLTVAGRPFGRWLEQARAEGGQAASAGGTRSAHAVDGQPARAGDGQSASPDAARSAFFGEAQQGQAGLGPAVPGTPAAEDDAEKGSIILLLATDAPLDARQLRRLSLRAGAGLARTGSVFGHGSGDIALAFSTAYTVPHLAQRAMPAVAMLHEARIDPLFEAAAEAIEQAILHGLWHAESVTGRDGHRRLGVRDAIPAWQQWLDRRA
ncbi:aminopeptidase [Bordetella sp. H567]|uniref:DmpA family aminopeptidase n=1 Tax=Bordetella sp. H567 TaxID=1697043 RepID=UPI00081C6411|nr:P1 family peptidase [Bordetella sp. H567]AOB30641.1 aminopeptidase [Bordetella sp. H567]